MFKSESELKAMDGTTGTRQVMDVDGWIITSESEFNDLAECGQLSKKTVRKGYVPNATESWIWKFGYSRFGYATVYMTEFVRTSNA